MTVKLVVSGCAGRMGSRIAALALADAVFQVVGGIEASGHQAVGKDLGLVLGARALGVFVSDKADGALASGDVLIEFTQPDATMHHVQIARRLKKAMVIGTTGLSDAQRATLKEAATDIPIVFSPNMSLGVNLLFELVQTAARRLGSGYAVAIEETHHQGKKDAPSGTAKRLQELLMAVRSQSKAATDAVPCRSIRMGDVVGEHTVVFTSPFEQVTMTHEALSRDVFALGALKAAQFVRTQPPGLYEMSHVLRASEVS